MKTIAATVAICCLSTSTIFSAEFRDFTMSQKGGIEQQNPNTSFTTLSYRLPSGSCPNTAKNALFKMNIIGAGTNQVPPGSTIVSATLWLTAAVGNDGWLYRCAEPWDASPTWNELGGSVFTTGASIGIGMNTNQTFLQM